MMPLFTSGHKTYDAWMYCCLPLAAPIGLSPFTLALSLNPFSPQVAAPIGLSPPCALPFPAWPILTSLLTLPFPWKAVPREPPDSPCFTALCRVHKEEGNCPHCWPGASK